MAPTKYNVKYNLFYKNIFKCILLGFSGDSPNSNNFPPSLKSSFSELKFLSTSSLFYLSSSNLNFSNSAYLCYSISSYYYYTFVNYYGLVSFLTSFFSCFLLPLPYLSSLFLISSNYFSYFSYSSYFIFNRNLKL